VLRDELGRDFSLAFTEGQCPAYSARVTTTPGVQYTTVEAGVGDFEGGVRVRVYDGATSLCWQRPGSYPPFVPCDESSSSQVSAFRLLVPGFRLT
jgi:hypothetical protein